MIKSYWRNLYDKGIVAGFERRIAIVHVKPESGCNGARNSSCAQDPSMNET